MSIVRELDCITLHVTDLEASRRFYRDVMGFRELVFAQGLLVFALPGGARLSMHVQEPGEPGRPAGTVSGLMFGVDDCAKAVEALRGRGADVLEGPWKAPWGPTYATVADPSGNEFLLIERDRPLPAP
ncbi:MAG TPA: VOC family protein [Candidatus Thermoplasmatota archaeon]|nr:VOC family protein [Candidatus Thermoplasmatota archaeon]